MSPFVSKGVSSCARDTVFSGQIGTAGKGGVGMCWLVAEKEASFIVWQVFGHGVWVCNFRRFTFLQQTFKQEHCPLTAVYFDFSLLAKYLLQIMSWGETVGACFRYTDIRHPNEEAAGVSLCFPAVVVSGQMSRPCPWRGALCGHAVAPRWQLATFLVILCRKGVLGVLRLFSLDHWVQLCLMSWKRSRSIKHVFIVSRIPVGPCVCL